MMPYNERDRQLLEISLELHEALFKDFMLNHSEDGCSQEELEDTIISLKQIHIKLSGLIDEYWRFGRTFLKPIAELRSKVICYRLHLIQMREPK